MNNTGALEPFKKYFSISPKSIAIVKKSARVSNIVIFLSAWACIKIPQELVELQFLGLNFMVARLVLTIVFVILIGLLIEKLIAFSDRRQAESQ